ncbi:MAG TPA: YsnF/AvaK domain-containing protein [Bryobacteraceae bacterium]|jgi:stress response protein YsnF|nr:YsnF/AvaK domain-containing protein [Bryobacteraceae bacterium]
MAEDRSGEIVVPVIQEEAHAGTVPVQTGAVRVTKSVETHEELVEQELRKGRAEVQRVAVHRVVDGPQPPRREGNTLVIPVVSEILNGCQKQWVVTEEIRVTRLETAETVQQKVELASERAQVERLDEQGRVIATEETAPQAAPAVDSPVAADSILEKRKSANAAAAPGKVLSSTDSILRKRLPKKRGG